MAAPEYLICLNCETPVYIFEWDIGKDQLEEILCGTCGSEEEAEFLTQSEYDEQSGA